MKTTLLILLLAIPAYSQVTARYDKFKDVTYLSTEAIKLGPRVTMVVKGVQEKGAISPYLVVYSGSRSWMFLRSRGLIFLADNERIDLGDGSHDGKVSTGTYSTGGVRETIIYRIDRAHLEKLANAASVEVKLGYLETKVEDRKPFREMLEYK
jgi:hypothetical protein